MTMQYFHRYSIIINDLGVDAA